MCEIKSLITSLKSREQKKRKSTNLVVNRTIKVQRPLAEILGFLLLKNRVGTERETSEHSTHEQENKILQVNVILTKSWDYTTHKQDTPERCDSVILSDREEDETHPLSLSQKLGSAHRGGTWTESPTLDDTNDQ